MPDYHELRTALTALDDTQAMREVGRKAKKLMNAQRGASELYAALILEAAGAKKLALGPGLE